ncbi:MAG: hypothetical protein ACRYG7_14125 [Janthinobacterium lividum]
MNIIKLRSIKNKDGELLGPAKAFIKTTAAADVDESLGGAIRFAFEIEIMQGEHRPRPGGGSIYRFELDEEKALQLAQLVTLMFFPTNHN